MRGTRRSTQLLPDDQAFGCQTHLPMCHAPKDVQPQLHLVLAHRVYRHSTVLEYKSWVGLANVKGVGVLGVQ